MATRITDRGFSLIELVIALAIIALLAAIALPAYQDHMIKTRRADCQGALTSLANALEQFYTQNGTYVGSAQAGTLPRAPTATVFPSQCPIDSRNKFYNLTIQAASGSTYTIRATPIAGTHQAADGYFELDATGARRWDKNNDGDTGDTDENIW